MTERKKKGTIWSDMNTLLIYLNLDDCQAYTFIKIAWAICRRFVHFTTLYLSKILVAFQQINSQDSRPVLCKVVSLGTIRWRP